MKGFTYCVRDSPECPGEPSSLPCGAAPAGCSTPTTSAAPATIAPHQTLTRNLRNAIPTPSANRRMTTLSGRLLPFHSERLVGNWGEMAATGPFDCPVSAKASALGPRSAVLIAWRYSWLMCGMGDELRIQPCCSSREAVDRRSADRPTQLSAGCSATRATRRTGGRGDARGVLIE